MPCLGFGSDFVLEDSGSHRRFEAGECHGHICVLEQSSWLSTEEQNGRLEVGRPLKGLQSTGGRGVQSWGLDLGMAEELVTKGARREGSSQSPGDSWNGCELCLLPPPNS